MGSDFSFDSDSESYRVNLPKMPYMSLIIGFGGLECENNL